MALPNISLKRTRREASLVYAGIPAARRLASPFGILLSAEVGHWRCASLGANPIVAEVAKGLVVVHDALGNANGAVVRSPTRERSRRIKR
jgi:hypothetical protein